MCRSWCHCDGGQGLEREKTRPERVQRRQLTTQQMMKDKTTVTGDDLRVSTRAIYFANWHVSRIGGGQHGIVLNALRASPFRTSHMLGMRHMIHMCIPSLHVTLSRNSSDILWRDLLDLYHRDSGAQRESPGLAIAHKIKRECITHISFKDESGFGNTTLYVCKHHSSLIFT